VVTSGSPETTPRRSASVRFVEKKTWPSREAVWARSTRWDTSVSTPGGVAVRTVTVRFGLIPKKYTGMFRSRSPRR
jgi:hypothetical protein